MPAAETNRFADMHPSEIDTELAPIYGRYQTAKIKAAHLRSELLPKYNRRLGREVPPTDEQAARIHAEIDKQMTAAVAAQHEMAPYEAEFARRGGWTRAYLVTSSDGGHVHKDMACSTCHWDTEFGWLTDESGRPEDEIVARNAAEACTVCYPSAPVEAREEAKAARDAKKCEHSGKYVPTNGRRYVRCPGCGTTQSVTPNGLVRAHDSAAEMERKKAASDAAALKDEKSIVPTRTSDGVVKTVIAARNNIKDRLGALAMYRRYNNPRPGDTGPGPWDHPSADEWMDDVHKLDKALRDKGIDTREFYAKWRKSIPKDTGDRFVEVPGVTDRED